MTRIWLMKSEPDVFSIGDLKRRRKSLWDGVRNYQARNFMTQDMRVGDTILFYHSNAEPPGVAGLAKVSGKAIADPTQFDRKSKYFEPRATKEKPVWFCVEVEFVSEFPRLVPLDEIRSNSILKSMALLQRGQRLSIQPVTESQFQTIVQMAETR